MPAPAISELTERCRLSTTSPPLSALGAPSCGVSCCSFPDGAEPAFDRGRQLFLRAGAHPARPRRRIAAGIAMRSRHCSRRRRCGSPQQFSGTSRSAAQGPRAADSPLEGDGFELVVRRCVVGSRLADDIAEAPRPADLGGLRRSASAGMTKARCRVILGALPT